MSLTSTFPFGPVTLSQNARNVLGKRYLVKDKTGSPTESPEELFWRVATVVAEADARYGATEGAVQAVAGEFYYLMTPRRFEPNSPPPINPGRPLGPPPPGLRLPLGDAPPNGHKRPYTTAKAIAHY